MATHWFYLDGSKQHGPVSGQELKDFADFAKIFPWTPVRREHNGETIPWTRAGAIKALFPNDVTDQLGPPICDDCGAAMPGGSCPNCAKPEPEVVEQKPLPARTVPSSETVLEKKYPHLRTYIWLLKAIGSLVAVIVLLVAAVEVLPDLAVRMESGGLSIGYMVWLVIVSIAALAVALVCAVVSWAVAEFLQVSIDIEENTRRMILNEKQK